MGAVLAPARPSVKLDGQAAPALTEGLLRLQVRETEEGLSSCEATFGNWGRAAARLGFLYFDRDQLDFGKALRPSRSATTRCSTAGSPALEADFPDGGAARRSTVLAEDRFAGPADDPADPHLHRDSRRGRSSGRSPRDHGLTPDVDCDAARPTWCWPSSTRATSRSCATARGRSTPSCGSTDRTLHVATRSRRRASRAAAARVRPRAARVPRPGRPGRAAHRASTVDRLGRGGQAGARPSRPTTVARAELGSGRQRRERPRRRRSASASETVHPRRAAAPAPEARSRGGGDLPPRCARRFVIGRGRGRDRRGAARRRDACS